MAVARARRRWWWSALRAQLAELPDQLRCESNVAL